MKPLIVGLAPSRTMRDPNEPLSGNSGRRLAVLCGLTHDEFLRRFDRVNLFPCYLDRSSPLMPRIAALALEEKVAAREHVVFLGLAVARAFKLPTVPVMEWAQLFRDGPRYAVAPHPSGKSRWWNDHQHRVVAAAFWSELASIARFPAA